MALQVMMEKVVLLPLFLLLTSITGVCPLKEIQVKAGELVELYCDLDHRGYNHGDAKVIWTSYTNQEVDLISHVSSAEQRQRGVLLHNSSLVILRASKMHEGNYSCSLRNGSSQFWFRLVVLTTQSTEYQKYPNTCAEPEACTLTCCEVFKNGHVMPNMSSNGTIWHKEGQLAPTESYFSSVKKNDAGVYTCTRLYLYDGQAYKRTFTMVLDVKPKEKPLKYGEITSPENNEIFLVDLGFPMVIDCKAVLDSEFDDISWNRGTNKSFPVFFNISRKYIDGKIKMKASLVFKKVSKEDLSNNYTCQLESELWPSSSVTIILAQKAPISFVPLALGIVFVCVVIVLTVGLYVRFKVIITLFLRDTLGCHSSTSDGKIYDVFLMYYKSDAEAGLCEEDRKYLESVLEERFGYSLCLYERDVLPGQAEAEALLECIEQSRTVVLVPTSPGPCPGSGLLVALHEALVERQTRLVFISTDTTEGLRSGLLAETLQLLRETGECVTWKDKSSMQLSSSFWKQLRYYLPAPQYAPRIRLLPQTV